MKLRNCHWATLIENKTSGLRAIILEVDRSDRQLPIFIQYLNGPTMREHPRYFRKVKDET